MSPVRTVSFVVKNLMAGLISRLSLYEIIPACGASGGARNVPLAWPQGEITVLLFGYVCLLSITVVICFSLITFFIYIYKIPGGIPTQLFSHHRPPRSSAPASGSATPPSPPQGSNALSFCLPACTQKHARKSRRIHRSELARSRSVLRLGNNGKAGGKKMIQASNRAVERTALYYLSWIGRWEFFHSCCQNNEWRPAC